MSDNPPRMDYRQHRRARRLVHECCNYLMHSIINLNITSVIPCFFNKMSSVRCCINQNILRFCFNAPLNYCL